MTKKRDVCGSYPGAVPWTTHSDEPPAQLAAELARSAGCAYYTVDGVTYGPFDESAEEEAGAFPASGPDLRPVVSIGGNAVEDTAALYDDDGANPARERADQ